MTDTAITNTGATMRCRMMSKRQRAHFLREYLSIKKYDWMRLPHHQTELTQQLIAKLDILIRGKEPVNEQSMKMLMSLYKDYLAEKELSSTSSTSMEVPS